MSILQNLSLAEPETHGAVDVFQRSKQFLIDNLAMQQKCAEALVAGTNPPENAPKRRWYFRDSEGNVRLGLRVGNQGMEIVKGRPHIIVGKDANTPKVIRQLIDAVKAGELDSQIKEVIKSRKPQPRKSS